MSGLRANVYSYFSNKYGIEESSAFWSSDFEGEVPEEVLRQKTIELLKRIKIEQILMREHGIADDISLTDFSRNWRMRIKEGNQLWQNTSLYMVLSGSKKRYTLITCILKESENSSVF
jgi:hypothetical protein